ncbi:neurotrophin 1-like [Daktulosphaira vitifoliae]|uniref:neurotrophin 1-like n=1 Tax=Daktulosphaira vitifoliae TaxID=58002 RepID=UPI0021A980A2|nr:neurotrophin 1-like [Daktulosphaira vitifoliae]
MYKVGIFLLFVAAAFAAVVCDELEDFPLDDRSNAQDNDGSNSPNTTSMNGVEETIDPNSVDLDNDAPDNSAVNMADRKADIMQKLIQKAMHNPGTKEKLAQVVPIIKAMTAAQRLALAGMVMGKGQTHNLKNKELNAQLLLPISLDIAAMLRSGNNGDESSARASNFGSYHIHGSPISSNRLRSPNPLTRRFPQRIPELTGMKRPYFPINSIAPKRPPKVQEPVLPTIESFTDDCDLFGDSICLNVQSYPDIEITETIEDTANSKTAFQALLKDPKYNMTTSYDANITERRIDENLENAICQSQVTLARPKKARSTNGQWKYVVNTDEYVQTLRLEKCLKPDTRCSHVSTKFKSTCRQVYNYHRLLTWDQFSGLTMDIFKVPTCCSCHLQELNPLISDSLDSHNLVFDDLNPQSTNTNQKKLSNVKRLPTPHSATDQYVVHETHPAKYPPNARRPYKKNKNRPTTTTTQIMVTDSPDSSPTTKTNYNYHPIMEYFVSPQPTPLEPKVQNVAQRKSDLMVSKEYNAANNGWNPMMDDYGPRSL